MRAPVAEIRTASGEKGDYRGLCAPSVARFQARDREVAGQTTLHHKLPKFLIGTPIKHLGFNSSS
jgi:hypothetical protein